jgi:hypothetical protein
LAIVSKERRRLTVLPLVEDAVTADVRIARAEVAAVKETILLLLFGFNY